MRIISLGLIMFMSVALSLSACSKKDAPKTDDTAVHPPQTEEAAKTAAPEEAANAPLNADADNQDQAPKADDPEPKAPEEKAEAKPIDPEEAKSMDLAVDPKTCVVTHCKAFPGFEESGLDCNTDEIVKAGYHLDDKVLYAILIKRGGPACEVKDKVVECFLTEYDFTHKSTLRKENKDIELVCDPNCILTDISQCEAKDTDKDLAVDPLTCVVTHCKSYPGFENDGLECNTEAIVKAGHAFGDQLSRMTYRTFSGEDCNTVETSVKCFMKEKDFVKECKAKGNDFCDNYTFFIDESKCPKEAD